MAVDLKLNPSNGIEVVEADSFKRWGIRFYRVTFSCHR
jgi:hypothetical protein